MTPQEELELIEIELELRKRSGATEKPYSVKRQAQAAISGFNRSPAFLAGLPVDTLLNLADMTKVGIGTVYGGITGKPPPAALDPVQDRSRLPLTSAWFNRGLDAIGATAPSAEAEYPGTAAFATGAGSTLAGRPTKAAEAILRAAMGGTSSQIGNEVYRATGDPAVAALASLGVPAAAAGTVVGGTKLAGKFIVPAEETVRVLLDPKRAERVAARTWERTIGEKNLPTVVQRVSQQAGRPQPVKGYQPTIAETLTDDTSGSYRIMPEGAGVQAVQKSLASTKGEPQAIMRRARYGQDDALRGALRPIAQDETALEAARTARTQASNVNYPAALSQNMRVDGRLMGITESPYFERAYAASRDMAADVARKQGKPLTLAQELHYTKLALDDMIQRKVGENALSDTQRRQAYGVQRELVGWLKDNNKAYEAAREIHKQLSIPINRMEVGQALEDRMFSPRGDVTPGSFLRAISDETRTVKTATGQPRQDFGQVLSKPQEQTVRNIGGLLERRWAADNPRDPVRIGAHNVAEESVTALPNLLYRPAMIANFILRKVASGNLENQVDELMAMQATNPRAFADALKQLPTNTSQSVINAMTSRQAMRNVGGGLLMGGLPALQQNMNDSLR